jgi:amino acid transporter
MWRDKHKLSTYHKVVRVIAGIMALSTGFGVFLILPTHGSHIDPVVKWTILAILVLLFVLTALMFRSPSRDP